MGFWRYQTLAEPQRGHLTAADGNGQPSSGNKTALSGESLLHWETVICWIFFLVAIAHNLSLQGEIAMESLGVKSGIMPRAICGRAGPVRQVSVLMFVVEGGGGLKLENRTYWGPRRTL
jgi:hypothetical protein